MELVKKTLPNKLKIFWGEDMEDYRIVVDQSTSGTKVLLFNTLKDIKLIDRIDKAHRQLYPHKGWVEHDPYEIISNIKELIDLMIRKHKLDYKIIKSLSITNQRESVVVWDKKTGKTYTNVMVWQCNRGLKICEELKQKNYEDSIREKTGLNIDPYFSAPKLKWFFNNNKFSATELETMAIGTIDTWIIWNLTKGKKFLTDISNASRTQLFNINTLKWDSELIDIFNIPIENLPEVVDSVYNFGNYKEVPIVSVIADSQAALLGHSCTNLGDVKATLGTGSSMLLNIGSKKLENKGGILTTIAWKKNDEIVYALEGAIRSYGDILNWMKEDLNLFQDYNEASELAFRLSSNQGVYLIPALSGLGAPFWRPDVTASFVGLTRDINKNHMIRAGFEAMAFQTRAVIEEFEKDKNIQIKTIKVDGGSTNNEYFMQLLADITRCEIIVSSIEEASALGTLMILEDTIMEEQSFTKMYSPNKTYENEYKKWKNYITILLEK